jgi:galactokinase
MDAITVRVPGRVNVIGEHTDYNGGYVMPAAIGYETRAHAKPRHDRIITVDSEALDDAVFFDLDTLAPEHRGDWTDYARGIVLELRAAGVELRGADIRIETSLPLGGGLSSSASFDIALALAVLASSGADMPRRDLAALSQRADAEHVGIRSGLMDQYAVLFARAGNAMLLDTRTLFFDFHPIPAGATLVVCNTMVRHALAGGEYNQRRAECEEALSLLRRRFPNARDLCDISPEEFASTGDLLPEPLYRRARHVVTEQARTRAAAAAFDAGDLRTAGKLMNASHESLRDDYEVSCAELDTMVEIARACDGVYGSRMTGGGFGGCTVTLLDAGHADAFRTAVAERYARQTGIVPEIYDGTPVDGAAYAVA